MTSATVRKIAGQRQNSYLYEARNMHTSHTAVRSEPSDSLIHGEALLRESLAGRRRATTEPAGDVHDSEGMGAEGAPPSGKMLVAVWNSASETDEDVELLARLKQRYGA